MQVLYPVVLCYLCMIANLFRPPVKFDSVLFLPEAKTASAVRRRSAAGSGNAVFDCNGIVFTAEGVAEPGECSGNNEWA